eukprot:COSAG03_NODE_13292_length_508_cov_213.987775_1_plen_95_part_10
MACAAVWLVFACYLCMLCNDRALRSHGMLPYFLGAYSVVAAVLAITVFAAWLLSFLLAVSLATGAVKDLRDVVADWSPARGGMAHGLQHRNDYRA